MKKNKVEEPQYVKSPLNTDMINYAVYYMSAKEKLLYTLLTFVLGGAAGFIFYGGLFKEDGEATLATHISNIIVFAVVGLIASKVFVPMINKMLKNKRDVKLQKQFMDLLECLATSLGAGNTVNDAFSNAAQDLLNQYTENDMIILEVNEIIQGISNGMTLEEMLTNFGERSGNEDIQNFSNVMTNCYRLGGDFRNVVKKTRDIISDKIVIKEEINTKISSNKLQHNAMSLMPIALVAMLKVTNASFSDNLASPLGVIVTTVAIGIFVGAYLWGKKIITIE